MGHLVDASGGDIVGGAGFGHDGLSISAAFTTRLDRVEWRERVARCKQTILWKEWSSSR